MSDTIEVPSAPKPAAPAEGAAQPAAAVAPAKPRLTGKEPTAARVLELVVKKATIPAQVEDAARQLADLGFAPEAKATVQPESTEKAEGALAGETTNPAKPAAEPEPTKFEVDEFDYPDAPDDSEVIKPIFPTNRPSSTPLSPGAATDARGNKIPDTRTPLLDTADKPPSPESAPAAPEVDVNPENLPYKERQLDTMDAILTLRSAINDVLDLDPTLKDITLVKECIDPATGKLDPAKTGRLLEVVQGENPQSSEIIKRTLQTTETQHQKEIAEAQARGETVDGTAYHARIDALASSITVTTDGIPMRYVDILNDPNYPDPQLEPEDKEYIMENGEFAFNNASRIPEAPSDKLSPRRQQISEFRAEIDKANTEAANAQQGIDATNANIARLQGQLAEAIKEKDRDAANSLRDLITAEKNAINRLEGRKEAAQRRAEQGEEKLFPLEVDQKIEDEVERLKTLPNAKSKEVQLAIRYLTIAGAADRSEAGTILKSQALTESTKIQEPLKPGEQPTSQNDLLLENLRQRALAATPLLEHKISQLLVRPEVKKTLIDAITNGELPKALITDVHLARNEDVVRLFFDATTKEEIKKMIELLDEKSRLLWKDRRKRGAGIITAILAVIAEQIGGALMDEAEQDLTTPVTGSQRAA